MRATKSSKDGSFGAALYSDLIPAGLYMAQNSMYSRGSVCSCIIPVSVKSLYYQVLYTVSDITIDFHVAAFRRTGTNA